MLYLIGEILKTLQFLWRFQTSEEFVEKNMSRRVVRQITTLLTVCVLPKMENPDLTHFLVLSTD